MNKKEYSEYLKNPKWQKKRLESINSKWIFTFCSHNG